MGGRKVTEAEVRAVEWEIDTHERVPPNRIYIDRRGPFRWVWEVRHGGAHLDNGSARTKRGALDAARLRLGQEYDREDQYAAVVQVNR